MIWLGDRERWISVGQDVADLIGPESVDRFAVQPFQEAGLSNLTAE